MQSEWSRYSCQMALPGFGEPAQQLLQQARVLIVGAGGLGCPAAQYLAASGVGTLGIADDDTVSVSNLHRQILYSPADVGLSKAETACQRLQTQNPGIKLIPHLTRLTSHNVSALFAQYDIIIDATDNFETRYLLNDAAVLAGKPLVYGAIYQYEGQVAVWNVLNVDGSRSPHYRDLFPEVDATQVPNCAEGGVIPTLAGIIGCMQANEVIKYITGAGDLLQGKVLIYDALSMKSRIIKLGNISKVSITQLAITQPVTSISVSELQEQLLQEKLELIDIRSEQERDLFDIGGTHIPAEELIENLDYVISGKPKVLYCATGKRSDEAVINLHKLAPHAQIFSLKGGLKSWLEQEEG